jgi:hypothetical protein
MPDWSSITVSVSTQLIFRYHRPLRCSGIDSQPGGPVRQPYLTHRPARLHRLAESIPWIRFLRSLKGLQIRALICFIWSNICWWNNGAVCCERESLWLIVQQWPVQSKWQAVDGYRPVPVGGDHTANSTLGISYSLPQSWQCLIG